MTTYKRKILTQTIAICIPLTLAGCNGKDGADGAVGLPGLDGSGGLEGIQSLVAQVSLSSGNSMCFNGGVQIKSGKDTDRDGILSADEVSATSYLCAPGVPNLHKNFNRIATFPVCLQEGVGCNSDIVTAAEIVAASADGNTLIYTDSPGSQIGFVDITDPNDPAAAGAVALAGEPTSVAVKGEYALVGVNTSVDFVDVAGSLAVVHIANQDIVAMLDLGGQPDSVAVSPDGNYAAVVIENQRDEDLGEGVPPQAPAGKLVIVDLLGEPTAWTTRDVDLTDMATLFPGDPEPEFVDINSANLAVVSLQENNHLAIIDLVDGSLVNHFSAGEVDLIGVDVTEESPALIDQSETLESVKREPDGVAWINEEYFVTADEGDLDGGSRGFTIFSKSGSVVYSSGNQLDQLSARFGHYPDGRSGNKGVEPENVEVGVFGSGRYLFVNAERASLVFVFDVADPTQPVFKQVLPAALGPEGAHAIVSRNLLIVASEEDSREDGLRGSLNIYRYATGDVSYPTIVSEDRWDGAPIPWSALSGLAADPTDANRIYSTEDSAFQSSRIFEIDVRERPARLTREIRIRDARGVFADYAVQPLADEAVADDDVSRINVFDQADLNLLINDDTTVNLDPEGIAVASDGGFWIASEGSGTMGEPKRPINSLNWIFKTDAQGVIEQVISLPESVNAKQSRFGFEGVAEYNGALYVAFQRAWADDKHVHIGVYDLTEQSWIFLCYPLDAAESANGGWVGLSELTALGDGRFLVVERDNQSGPDAVIKRLYTFDTTGLSHGDLVEKHLASDLTDALRAQGGLIPEKIEGAAVLNDGSVLIVNDNDGVDDNSGETQLLNLGRILKR